MDDTVIDLGGANASLWLAALKTLLNRHRDQTDIWFYSDAADALGTLAREGIVGILGHHEWPWSVHLALCAWEDLPAGISHADVIAQIDWLEGHLPSCL
jgi:hypothetical protein